MHLLYARHCVQCCGFSIEENEYNPCIHKASQQGKKLLVLNNSLQEQRLLGREVGGYHGAHSWGI